MHHKKTLQELLDECVLGRHRSQKSLYELYYGYAMSICLRYAGCREDAVEILNDAFLKVFRRIATYHPGYPFKSWLRRILINSCIDHFRRNERFWPVVGDIGSLVDEATSEEIEPDTELLSLVQQLSPQYRIVFNLYVMEEYKHQEIAQLLDITEGTSRSNLLRAKAKLKEQILTLRETKKSSFKYGRFLQTN